MQRQDDIQVRDRMREAIDRLIDILSRQHNHLLPEMQSLYDHGRRLLSSIEVEQFRASQDPVNSFDEALYANILNRASDVLAQQASPQSVTAFYATAQLNLQGRGSVGRGVVGGMLAFLGAGLIAVSIAVLAGVLPIVSWPVAAAGIAIGAILLSKGVRLMSSSKTTGIAQAINHFTKEAKQISRHSCFYHVPPAGVEVSEEATAPALLSAPQ